MPKKKPKPKSFPIAVIQMSTDPDDRGRNLRVAEGFVRAAAAGGAKLIVLPEFFNCGYSYQLRARAAREPLDGPTAGWMADLAAELGVWLCGCIYEDSTTACFNTFLLVGPKGGTFTHRKRSPAAFEQTLFEPGTDPAVVDTPLGRIAPVICKDSILTKNLEEVAAGKPDLIIVVYSSPNPYPPWLARAIGLPNDEIIHRLVGTWAAVCGVPAAAACVTGRWRVTAPGVPFGLGRIPFHGQSCIVDAEGKVITDIYMDEGVAQAEVTPGNPRPTREMPSRKMVVDCIPEYYLRIERPAMEIGRMFYERWKKKGFR